jgi:hypothetical protein
VSPWALDLFFKIEVLRFEIIFDSAFSQVLYPMGCCYIPQEMFHAIVKTDRISNLGTVGHALHVKH